MAWLGVEPMIGSLHA